MPNTQREIVERIREQGTSLGHMDARRRSIAVKAAKQTQGQSMMVCAVTVEKNPRAIPVSDRAERCVVGRGAELFLVPLAVVCGFDADVFFAGDHRGSDHAEQLTRVLYRDVPTELLAYVCKHVGTSYDLFSLFDRRKDELDAVVCGSSVNYTLAQFIKELAAAFERKARADQ